MSWSASEVAGIRLGQKSPIVRVRSPCVQKTLSKLGREQANQISKAFCDAAFGSKKEITLSFILNQKPDN
jgi:hypothetical protein